MFRIQSGSIDISKIIHYYQKQQMNPDDSFQRLIPTKNMPALLSYYFGCAGVLPIVGLPFSVLAIILGRKGLRQYNKNPSPGAKVHAKIGIYFGAFELVFFALVIILVILFAGAKA